MMAMLGAQAHAGLLASAVNPFKAARQHAQARDDAEALLERFRIPAQYHPRRPKEISYGMQRMLSIALAYGRGASVLLLDEPAAGLGGAGMAEPVRPLTRLNAGGLAVENGRAAGREKG